MLQDRIIFFITSLFEIFPNNGYLNDAFTKFYISEDWVCAILDRLIDRWSHKEPLQIPEELESYSCEEVTVENGDLMCTDGYSGGSICFAMCKPGYLKQETGANHKRCQKKKSWERLLQRGKAPLTWSKNKVSCEKHFIRESFLPVIVKF